ncbi:NUT family member 2G-like [Prionailurus viverrinus]|uniref:NUT family member 2G-like n=1 Tax=Prionailurus viverrinus TaxID=61388 RepID=UPI001FF6248D|nr:NUT family member 2G-like [Prionailurus viverrinus]
MASEGASPVLGPHVAMDPEASVSSLTAQPFPPPAAGASHWSPRGQHSPPHVTPPFTPGSPVVLPTFCRTPLVAGDAVHGPGGTRARNIIVQVRSEWGPADAPQTQTVVLTQAPAHWSPPGALCGGAACPTPLFLATSAAESPVSAPAVGGTWAGKGGSSPGLRPQAPPPAVRLAPMVSPGTAGPQPPAAAREGSLARGPAKASPVDSCSPKSVYENFRRWQCFKVLARRHLPQSPDAEALSCFLIPVLRSLARLKPTMTLEEGVWRAVQEWQCRSNFDRVIYYEMAGKFMEFEAEEEIQIQKLQWVKVAQGASAPAPPKPGTQGSPALEGGRQPACIPRKAGSRAQPPCWQPHRPLQPKAPKEIPPEAVREYVDIMEGLLGPACSAPGALAGEWGQDGEEPRQDEDAIYLDPGLLSYIDKLCSQEDFITKVEAVIHPRFLAELLSSEPQLDLLALAEKLEQEEGLSLAELVEKRLVALAVEDGVPTTPSHCAATLGSGPEGEARARPGVSREACPAESECQDLRRHSPAHAHPCRPRAFAASPGQQELPALRAGGLSSPPQGPGRTPPRPDPRDAPLFREAPPAREPGRPADGSSEDEEELPSLAFLLSSRHSLLPWGLSQSPAPAPGLPSPGGRRPRGAPQAPAAQRIGRSPAAPPAAKSRKRALCAGLAAAGKTPLPGASLRGSVRALAVGLLRPSLPPKRRCGSFVPGRRRKQHCSP